MKETVEVKDGSLSWVRSVISADKDIITWDERRDGVESHFWGVSGN